MIKFGTSGFRGVMGDTFTKESVQKVAYAICKVFENKKNDCKKVCIGFDNRFMSKTYAMWVAEVLAEKFEVYFFVNSAPSPMVCWYTKKFDLGVVLTASHNPYMYNGIKIFLKGAKECDDEFASKIEQFANNVEYKSIKSVAYDEAKQSKKIIELDDIKEYCNSILSLVDVNKIQKSNLKILVNSMHGNSVECFKYLFEKLNIKNYEIMNSNIDPYFENKLPAPYLYNLTEQAQRVKDEKFDLGIALDGDSDRFTLISNTGEIYDCNYVISVLYYYYIFAKNKKGSVVKNSALSNLVNLIAQKNNYKCYNALVGFKNIAKFLESTDAFIGAESNGIAYKEHTLSKDGIYTAIAVIDAIVLLNTSFENVLTKLQKDYNFKTTIIEFAYPITIAKKNKIIKLLIEDKKVPQIPSLALSNVDYSEGVKLEFEGGYWVMYRFSGNEPVIRIFTEMKDLKECNKVIELCEKFIGVKERQK